MGSTQSSTANNEAASDDGGAGAGLFSNLMYVLSATCM